MIRVIVKFHVDPAKTQDFLAVAEKLIAETRKEDGCVDYSLAQPPGGDGSTLVLIEHWKDQPCLDAHMETPHFKAHVPALDAFCTASPDVDMLHQII